MREILFKAKRVDNGEWVEGLLSKWKFRGTNLFVPCIQTIREWDSGDYLDFIEVDPATVCQFTGLLDKNGKNIFEGDVVLAIGGRGTLKKDNSDARRFVSRLFQDEWDWKDVRYEFVCKWNETFSGFYFPAHNHDYTNINCNVSRRDYEIIGNIHDKKDVNNGN